MTLLLALLAAQATHEERARAVDAAIVAERLRIASVREDIKAWARARNVYRKMLRLWREPIRASPLRRRVLLKVKTDDVD